jgi:hypothetical protein
MVMSARRETYRIYFTQEGWLVHSDAGCAQAGPYADQERAIARVLVAVRDARPSQLRIRTAPGEWRAEVVYSNEAETTASPRKAASAGGHPGFEGVPHGGS